MSNQLSNGLLGRRRRIIIAAPVNLTVPVISGTPTVGQVLSSTLGTWSGNPSLTYSRQWKRDGANISGETGVTYTIVSADAGMTITCTVTAANEVGTADATSDGMAVSAFDPTFTWIGQAQSGTTTSYSPTLNGLGADYAERYLLVAVYWARVGTSNSNLTGAKLNGVDVTPIVNTPSSPGGMCLYIIKAPTGNSVSSNFTFSNFATVTLTWSILTDLQSMVPVSSGKDTANNPSVNVSIPNKGIAFGYWACGYGASPGTNGWSSPMTMDLNNTISTQFRISVGHRIAASDIASYNVQHFFNYSGSLVAASFR